MAYSEDVNVNLNVLAGTMGGITAIMGGMSALTSSFGAMGTEASNAFGTLDGLLVTSTALIAGFAVKSAEAFGEYEQGMKIVQAVSNQTGSAMNELSSKANEMSVTYRTAIGDITDGLQTLGRAGLNSVSEQLEVLESGLQTAKLEGRSLNGVLEELIQNTAMLGGDLKSTNFGEQTEYVNSLLVGTSMTAPITSHDISQTLQYAGGTAAAAGANLENKDKLEDLMGTVAAFAQKGVTGSMAGTALRAFFTKPASQDKSVTAGLESIGLSADDLWENGGESMKSVSDQIGIIQRQMDKLNLSTMDQIEIWGKIVGAKMGQQMMKLDSSTIKDITRDIQSAQSAEDLATQTLQTYTQKLSEMQQQGELAFREFGEKAAFWLTPAVEAITWVLDKLSNPWVNTTVFAVAGSLLAHGFRKAYAMISTVWGQIKGLISDAISGIETISGMAGGPATGFTQSASAVEILNARLAQTNTELAQMQAQFMGIKAISGTGTAVIPLGLVDKNGKLPANILGTANQNVFLGNGSMIGGKYLGIGERGRYYDPSEVRKLTNDYRKSIQAFNKGQQDVIKQQKAAMTYTKLNGEQIYLNDKGANTFASYTKQFDTMTRAKAEFEGRQLVNNPSWIMSSKQVDERLAQQYPMVSSQTVEDNIKKFTKAGEMQVHSSLTSMTDAQFKDWEKRMNQSVYNLRTFESGNKSVYYDHRGKFNYEKFNQDQLNQENLRRHNELVSRSPHLATKTYIDDRGNEQKFHRVNSMAFMRERMWEEDRILQKEAQLKQYEQGRMNVINQQRARASGIGQGVAARSQQVLSKRLQGYSNWINRATTSTKNFVTSGITKAGRSLGILSLNTESMRNKFTVALTSIEKRMETTPITFEQALVEIQEALGVSATELGAMLTETSLGFERFNAQLMSLGLKTVNDEIATSEHTEALLIDKAATEQSALAKFKDAGISTFKSAIGFMGGPFMAAMLGVTFGMQALQSSQQKWQESMQKAADQLSEASDALSTAENNISETFDKENDNMTEANKDKALAEQYANVYDTFYQGNHDRNNLGRASFTSDVDMTGITDEETDEYRLLSEEEIAERNEAAETIALAEDENVKALKENTMQLVAATQAYSQSQSLEADSFKDGYWGMTGSFSNFTDWMGAAQEYVWNVGAWLPNANNSWQFGDARAGFLDNKTPILTGSQSDSNYAGSTEFGAILAADVYRFNDPNETATSTKYAEGLRQFFGSDYDRIISLMGSMDNKISNEYGSNISGKSALYTNVANMGAMDEDTMALAQMSMKNNKSDYQLLGKQMFRYEQSRGFGSGRTAYQDYGNISKAIKAQRAGNTTEYNKAMKKLGKDKLTVQDKNLDNTIKKLMALTGNKLTEQNILAMGQLQQLQDMYQVANETVAPGIMQTVQAAYQNVSATGTAAENASGAESGAVAAANNAAAIAAFLGAEAQSTAEKQAYKEYQRKGGTRSEDEFLAMLGDRGNTSDGAMYYRRQIWGSLGEAGYGVQNPESTAAQRAAAGQSAANEMEKAFMEGGKSAYQSTLNTVTQPLVNYAQKATMAAYDQSSIGEYGGGNDTGGGSGGSGGDGGSGSDSGSGSTKSRVDLVLCSKKTIPKLNVNLFKKPPNFTIKNKNFRVRDIKITSQDKPDAITDAIKNGIINAQKRMEPKIIQSEEAVYDPVTATEGTTTPSGSTPLSSTSN